MIRDLQKSITGHCKWNEPLSQHTTYGVGGPADVFVIPQDKKDLSRILQFAKKPDIPTTLIGLGSNLLVSDEGIRGIVICLNPSFNHLTFDGNHVTSGTGLMLGKLVKGTADHGLSGCENLIGIPGTVGGAISMNAGAYGQEISVFLTSVDIIDENGTFSTLSSNEITFDYRYSSFQKNAILLNAEFIFPNASFDDIQKRMDNARQKRKSSQPLNMRSAGSVFKNPKDYAAGYLIDQAGLKGTKIGNAQISEKHANFFVNTGEATASDIFSLIKLAKTTIKNKFNIDLELEIKLLGFNKGVLA